VNFEQKRFPIFNTYVDALTMEETIKRVETIIRNQVPVQHVVINASKINLMQKDEKLTQIVNNCPIINADGASIVWAARLLNIPVKERVTGIDLFVRLIHVADQKGYKVFLFGAKEKVVKKVEDNFRQQYKNLQIVGRRNGYFSIQEEQQIAEEIRKAKPDMLFVAFSSPKKEYWIKKYLDFMKVPFVMGVGGSFDVIAGVTSRAPKWMQGLGLEWLYRFMQEPRRMWKRYIIGNFKFVLLTVKTKIRKETIK
jgi:N-acetylglucosaminyldiphosphoundecaprenol N-acetyl-beta-D-mannosaminyltransferase